MNNNMIHERFWNKKRVLITGSSGFLGSWLTKELLHNGATVVGLDIRPFRETSILSRALINRITAIKGSVENFSLVSKIIKRNRIEYIFHLAAMSLVGACLKNPRLAFSTNISGTWNILEAAKGCDSIKAVIIASSDKAYGDHKNLPYTENHPLAGAHPYDVSKSCADLISQTYFKTYGLPVGIVRCGNIFGPGDFNYSRIVPDTIRCAFSGKKLLIRSNGKFLRDYIYIEDVVGGYLILAKQMRALKASGEAFNFSNEQPVSVLKLVRMIYTLAHRKPYYKILDSAKDEIKEQYLSAKKAYRLLGWKPAYTFDQGLKITMKWYKEQKA